MSLETRIALPQPVQEAYEIGEQDAISQLSGGQVNETFLVEGPERIFILRKLAPVLGASTIHTTCVVGNHLAAAGWEAPEILPTVGGDTYAQDEFGLLWHSMAHIPSDGVPSSNYDGNLALKAGEILARWHNTVKTLDYTPDSLPHFHDTDYIAKKLQSESPLLHPEIRYLAESFLADYRRQVEQPYDEAQIIHGDPKLDNMLYRKGEPFTFIDFDCIMRGSAWTDVGDFLRSLSGKLIGVGKNSEGVISSFTQGYLEVSDSKLDPDEATFYALQATRRIACELGMRYLSDSVDGQYYFTWDKTSYASRDEALHDKARMQYKILQTVHRYLNTRGGE